MSLVITSVTSENSKVIATVVAGKNVKASLVEYPKMEQTNLARVNALAGIVSHLNEQDDKVVDVCTMASVINGIKTLETISVALGDASIEEKIEAFITVMTTSKFKDSRIQISETEEDLWTAFLEHYESREIYVTDWARLDDRKNPKNTFEKGTIENILQSHMKAAWEVVKANGGVRERGRRRDNEVLDEENYGL